MYKTFTSYACISRTFHYLLDFQFSILLIYPVNNNVTHFLFANEEMAFQIIFTRFQGKTPKS